MILKHCKVQKTDIQGFYLSLLLSWLKVVESPLHVILRPMYAGYLSVLRTNDFRCVFRYYYHVFANTVSNGERSGSVVECLTRDRRAAGSSLTGVTALWSLSKTHLS